MSGANQLAEIYAVMPKAHWDIVRTTVKDAWTPDLVIAPEGEPYLYRWYVTPPKGEWGNLYFHIQCASDPERPLHDHPWDSTSRVLANGYDEEVQHTPWIANASTYTRRLREGALDCVFRRASEAHRIILPPEFPYSMTLFMTGPKVRDWGFWYPDGWHHYKRHVADRDGQSVHVHERP